MNSNLSEPSNSTAALQPFGPLATCIDYMIDAAQRTVLFWDVLRERGNQYRAHLAETVPDVLEYEVELVADGDPVADLAAIERGMAELLYLSLSA